MKFGSSFRDRDFPGSGHRDDLSMIAGELVKAGSGVGRAIKIALIAGGALVIAVGTFVVVIAWQLLTSPEVKMIGQAARDTAQATVIDASAAAKCQRLISEARAKGEFLPACASTYPAPPARPVDAGAVTQAVVRAALD